MRVLAMLLLRMQMYNRVSSGRLEELEHCGWIRESIEAFYNMRKGTHTRTHMHTGTDIERVSVHILNP